jgi:hypothetical protein
LRATIPAAPARVAPAGIGAKGLTRRIDEFLGARGYRGEPDAVVPPDPLPAPPPVPHPPAASQPELKPQPPAQTPLEFVCEDDVRQAIRAGRKLVIAERAIVTPSARELAEEHRVLTIAPWRP